MRRVVQRSQDRRVTSGARAQEWMQAVGSGGGGSVSRPAPPLRWCWESRFSLRAVGYIAAFVWAAVIHSSSFRLARAVMVEEATFELVAPATRNTPEDPDAQRLPLTRLTCSCKLSDARLKVLPLQDFLFLEEFEEDRDLGRMVAADRSGGGAAATVSGEPKQMSCGCKTQPAGASAHLPQPDGNKEGKANPGAGLAAAEPAG